MSQNLNVELTENELANCVANLPQYNKDHVGFKGMLNRYLGIKGKGKGITKKYKKCSALLTMFTAEPNTAKQKILDEAEASEACMLGCYLPEEIFLSLVYLSFPIAREIHDIAYSYSDKYFSPAAVYEMLKNTHFETEATKKECVSKTLSMLRKLCAIKGLRKGMLKQQILPVYDPQGLYAVLLTAVELGNGNSNEVNPYLYSYSFEITHDFVDYYCDIEYDKLVPEYTLYQFLNSAQDYTLQYTKGEWLVTNEPYKYLETGLTKNELNSKALEVADVKRAKNEKKLRDEYKKQHSQGTRIFVQ